MKRGFDYIGVTCVFYCYDKKGRLLLHKRSNKCRDEIGRWDAGGGNTQCISLTLNSLNEQKFQFNTYVT